MSISKTRVKTNKSSQTHPQAPLLRCIPTSQARYHHRIYPPQTYRAIQATHLQRIRSTLWDKCSRWTPLKQKIWLRSNNFYSCKNWSKTMHTRRLSSNWTSNRSLSNSNRWSNQRMPSSSQVVKCLSSSTLHSRRCFWRSECSNKCSKETKPTRFQIRVGAHRTTCKIGATTTEEK